MAQVKARGFRTVDIAHMGRNGYCQHFHVGGPETEALRGLLRTLALQPLAVNYYVGGSDPNRPKPPVGDACAMSGTMRWYWS